MGGERDVARIFSGRGINLSEPPPPNQISGSATDIYPLFWPVVGKYQLPDPKGFLSSELPALFSNYFCKRWSKKLLDDGQNGRQRTRGSYMKLSAEVKAELGKYAVNVEKSVAATLRKYAKSIDPSLAISIRESLFAKSSFSLYSRKFNPSKISGCTVSDTVAFKWSLNICLYHVLYSETPQCRHPRNKESPQIWTFDFVASLVFYVKQAFNTTFCRLDSACMSHSVRPHAIEPSSCLSSHLIQIICQSVPRRIGQSSINISCNYVMFSRASTIKI